MTARPLRVLFLSASAVGVAGIGLIGTLEQGAAQMLLWPWCGLYVAIGASFAVALLARVLDGASPLRMPSQAWKFAVAGVAVGGVASVAFSPFRSEQWIWTTVPFAAGVGFLLVVDAMAGGLRSQRAVVWIPGVLGVALSVTSLTMWAADQAVRWDLAVATGERLPAGVGGWIGWWFAARNSQPLGHVNYTGGSAVLFAPWLGWLAWRSRGPERLIWWTGTAACLLMLASSGSRGAWLGSVAAMAAVAVLVWWQAPQFRRRIGWVTVAAVGLAAVVAVAHPALRSSLRPRSVGELPNTSNAERRSMLSVGWRMGRDRPVVGWGLGAVPLVYEHYRGAEDYGPIGMLQVHSTPLNLWAEGGLTLVAVAAGILFLAGRTVWQLGRGRLLAADHPLWPAAISLLGYGVFATTDYQLDLPVIACGLAANLGVIAGAASGVPGGPALRHGRGAAAVLGLLLIGVGVVSVSWLRARHALAHGRLDAALRCQPHDSVLQVMLGLRCAEASRQAGEATERPRWADAARAALLRAMGDGAHAEIGHFNLGWLTIEPSPAEARGHFAVVLGIAPSRAGAWLGLALCALKTGDEKAAVDALAMECLAHPEFLHSGWWLQGGLADQRPAVLQALGEKLRRVEAAHRANTWPAPQARYYRALLHWLQGAGGLAELAEAADTPSRREFWRTLAEGPASGGQAGDASAVLQSALQKRDEAKNRLALKLRRILGRAPDAPLVERFLAAIDERTPDDLIRRGLLPVRERALPMVEDYSLKPGFGVRQRNPYAQRVRECLPQLRSPVAECFLEAALPAAGWLYDRELRSLASPGTLPQTPAFRLPALTP